jgi:hypothetical protein
MSWKNIPMLCKITLILILQEKNCSSITEIQAGKSGAALHKLCCFKKAVVRRSEWCGHK